MLVMSSQNEWQLLETFGSEVEARVVESFLRAQSVEVQLLDTHNIGYLPARGLGANAGLRMMVRADEVEHARELLRESRKGSHLEIVGDKVPVVKSSVEKWIILALLLVALITYFMTRGN